MMQWLLVSFFTYGELAAGIVALLFIYVRHMRGTLTPDLLKKIAFAFVLFSAGMLAIKIAGGYLLLRADPAGKLFLPPNQSWDWFAATVLSRFVFPFVMSLVAAAVMYVAAIGTNKYFTGELFAEEDKYIFVFAAFAVGWPNFIVYLGAAVILTVFLSGIAALRHGADTRIVLTDALLFAVPVTLLFANTLAPYLQLFTLGIAA